MNILGEGFDDYVTDQIYIRQEKYSRGYSLNRTTEDITFLNSKTSFARLMSSVEVTSGASNYDYVNSLNIKGLELAKNYVLFGGTSPIDRQFPNTNILESGFAPDNLNITKGINDYAAYGMGGLELGYRPMPGIESVEVKTDGDGFTNSATVELKAFNRQQLEIIDVLYMRLGYYMLLEWGHTTYWTNVRSLITDPSDNSLQSYFFNTGNKSVKNMLAKIKEKRKNSDGNYDALFGRVINFKWSYNPDNTFKIIIYLRSVGDVIEGVKMNTQKTISSGSVSISSTDQYAYKNGISNLYHNVKTNIFSGRGNYFVESTTNSLTFSGDITFVKVPFNGGGDQYYVKLNRLLAEFQYNYIYTLNGDSSEEVLDIDNNINNNLIPINELTISVDPRVCIVSRKDTVDPNALFPGRSLSNSFTYEFYTYLDNFVTTVGGEYFGKLMNIYVNFEFLMKKMDSLVDEKTNKVSLKQFLNSILNDISRALGGVNRLEVNITEDRVLRIIDKNPYPFNDSLIKSYSSPSKQKIAEFDAIGYTKDVTTLLPTLQPGVNTSVTSTVPYTSFLKEISIQTQITPEFAYIISAGAAANNRMVGEDATAFSRLNKGLKTRFAEKIVDGKDATTNNTPNQVFEASDTYFKWVVNGTNTNGSNMTWDDQLFETNKSVLNSLIYDINRRSSTSLQTASPTSGFIPVNISLTMDGLSGMKIFERFALESNFLPTNYPETMDILIKSITHKIKSNVWDTTIESIIVGKSSQKTSIAAYVPPTPTLTPSSTPVVTGPTILGNDADFWTLLAICVYEDGDNQGRADVAQSIYNRAGSGAYRGGTTIAGIIKSDGQYEPAFGRANRENSLGSKTASTWRAIKDKATAIAAIESSVKYVNIKETYTVKRGDTINSIAAIYGNEANDILSINGITNITVGQKIIINNSFTELKKTYKALKDLTLQKNAQNFIEGRSDFLSITQGNVDTRNRVIKAGPYDPTGKRGTFVMRGTNKPNNVYGWAYNYKTNKVYLPPDQNFWNSYASQF